MRAVIVVNPRSTAASARQLDLAARALRATCDVTVAETAYRGHAVELAAQARTDGVEVVIAFGGDGTANEVVQGLLGPHADAGTSVDAQAIPLLGLVPAGSTNVFARALGLPNDALAATSVLIEALEASRSRLIGLGEADGRWFTFSAGVGMDAEVVGEVDRRRADGARSTPGLYARASAGVYRRALLDRPRMTLTRPGEATLTDLSVAIVTNTSPWTYLHRRPITPTPQSSFDTGLDVYTRRSVGPIGLVRALSQLARPAVEPHGRGVAVLHDVAELTVHSDRALPFQVDGEYLGERTSVTFRAHPGVIRAVC